MTKAATEKMSWVKQGLIYCPNGQISWAQQYASLPTPVLLRHDRLRVYISSCDEKMIGRVGYVDVDPDNPKNILAVATKPVLDIGAPGRFDENGVVCSCIMKLENKLYM